MAFSISGLQQVSVGSSSLPSIWTYSTSDTAATVIAANYWGGAPASLKAGDIIHAKCANGFQSLAVSAIDVAAGTSTVGVIGDGGVWVQINCSGYGTPGVVGYGLAPIAGTIREFFHVLTTVVDADVVLNLDVGGTNCTGSATIAVAGVAVGDIDSATVSANGAVTKGALIRVESDGGGTAGAGVVYVLIRP